MILLLRALMRLLGFVLLVALALAGQASLDAQARHRRIAHVVAGQRIEHPRGDSQLQAILELDDQAIGGLMP